MLKFNIEVRKVAINSVQIRDYFNVNPDVLEVLGYKGKKSISVIRHFVENPLYLIQLRRKYEQ